MWPFLAQCPDYFFIYLLFLFYFIVSLKQGTFHEYILKMFSPLIISYMDVTEELVINDFYDNVTKESHGECVEE